MGNIGGDVLSKVLKSFSMAINKLIHELTEDTRILGDIKTRLLDQTSYHQTTDNITSEVPEFSQRNTEFKSNTQRLSNQKYRDIKLNNN
jgi:hypothetical protein